MKPPNSSSSRSASLLFSVENKSHSPKTRGNTSDNNTSLTSMVFEQAMDGIAVIDPTGLIIHTNPALLHILGISKEQNVNIHTITSDLNGPDFWQKTKAQIDKTGWWQGQFSFLYADKEKRSNLTIIYPLKNNKEDTIFYNIVFRNLEIQLAQQRYSQNPAQRDALTNLPNRSLFRDRLKVALARGKRNHTGIGVFFLDLDNFKAINDSLGHAVGDNLLKAVAKRLQKSLREEDTVSRVGGDEFLVLLPGTETEESARIVAQRILDDFSKPLSVGKQELFVSFSIGGALYPKHDDDVEGLIKKADMAMYKAKNNGKHGFCFYSKELKNIAKSRLAMEQSLRKGLLNDEFLVFFQPKIQISTGKLIGMEAVARWRRPKVGLVPPRDFIPLAEETGLILPLGEWIMRESCLLAAKLRQAGHKDLRVSVNISARQLLWQYDFVAMVEALLRETHLSPCALELEITEQVVTHNANGAMEVIEQLKELGVRLAIDNYGAGFSSLRHLQRVSFDIVKIDRSFIQDIDNNPSMALGIISLAKEMAMEVVGAGVEHQDQMDFLRAHGCDYVQGYLVSPPLPADTFTFLIKQNTWK